MKRVFAAIFAAVCLLCCTVTFTGCADPNLDFLDFELDADEEGYSVKAKEDNKPVGNIKIPNTYNGKPIVKVEIEAFLDCTEMTGLVIPDVVKKIGLSALSGCTGLVDLTIPFATENILSSMFITEASVVEGIKIPQSLKTIKVTGGNSIGSWAFADGKSLTSIILPNSTITIGDSAFNSCWNLEKITIPKNVLSIGWGAFTHCHDLEEINLPDSLISIGNLAFNGCWNLKSITLPEKLTKIGMRTFQACSSLATIVMPATLTYIDEGAFDGCLNLVEIYYGGTKQQWTDIEKYPQWKNRTGEFVVHCTDGDIAKADA